MPENLPTEAVLRELRLLVRRWRRQRPPVPWARIAGELGVSVSTAQNYANAKPPRIGKKRGPQVTPRQREYVAALLDGKTKTQAAKIAGCQTTTAAHQFIARANHSPVLLDYMADLLKKAGLDDDTLVRRLEMCTRATKVAGIAINKNTGTITEKLYHPDYNVQHNALRTALELRKHLGQKDEKGANAGSVQVFLTPGERLTIETLTGGPLAFPVIELEGDPNGDVRPSSARPLGGQPPPALSALPGESPGVPASHPGGD